MYSVAVIGSILPLHDVVEEVDASDNTRNHGARRLDPLLVALLLGHHQRVVVAVEDRRQIRQAGRQLNLSYRLSYIIINLTTTTVTFNSKNIV